MTVPPLKQREIALFFFPLLLNIQLMSVSHSIINGALARLEDSVTALAAFAVAMVVHLFFASPSYQNHTITVAVVRGKKSFRGMIIYILLLASYVSTMLCLIAFTPVGDFVFHHILSVRGVIASEARTVLGILSFLPFLTGFRGFFQGLVIKARRTSLVSAATGLRVLVLCLILFFGSRWSKGTELGAYAMLGCIIAETAMMGLVAARCPIPDEGGEDEKGVMDIIRFAFPISCSSNLHQTVPLLVNATMSRLPGATLALASLGVIRSLLFLLANPMANLQQVHLTLVKNSDHYNSLLRFYRYLATGFALCLVLIAYPFNDSVLGGLLGLDDQLRSYMAAPLAVCALYPFLFGASNLFRGFLAGINRTGAIGRSSAWKIVFLTCCCALLQFFPLDLPAIAIGTALFISAEIIEVAYLYRERKSHNIMPTNTN